MEPDVNILIRLFGTVADSIVDGPGLRYAVFVQGCSHGCPGCHNPASQPAAGGELRRIDDIVADIRANRLVHDVTLSGGEPFEQAEACAALAGRLKQHGYGIWTYTGYLYEDLLARAAADKHVRALLDATDVLVDGPFVETLKSLGLTWRGSSNQRLIDLAKMRAAGTAVDNIIPWEQHDSFPTKPASW